MPSEKPINGRCGAKCLQRRGLRLWVIHYDDKPDYDPDAEEQEGDLFSHEGTRVIEDDEITELTLEHAGHGELITFRGDEIDEEIRNLTNGPWDLDRLVTTDGEELSFHWDDWHCYSVSGREKELVGYCENFPMNNGRCYRHGGRAGAVEGNADPMTHGLYTSNPKYYDHISEEERAQIELWFESYMDEAEERGLFTRDHSGKVEMLKSVCIDLHKAQRANEYIAEEGLVNEFPLTDDDGNIVETPDGEPVMLAEENALNLPIDRLKRTMTRQLKELGFLDDPDSQQADAQQSLASALSNLD